MRERLEEMNHVEGVRITIFTCDRCAFSMSWEDHHLLGALHSDDGIFFYTSILIRDRFIGLLRERFLLETGPVNVYCGLEIDYQPERRMARIRQTRHIDMMLKIFRMSGARPERFPLPTGRPGELAAQRWNGEATERSHFDYAMFIGDLVWVTKTRFDLKHAAHLLAQHMRNPGPHQIHAANHVLRYLVGTRDMALVYSVPESPEGWPLRNKLLPMADSGHNHYGEPGETGVVILLNGGAIYAVTRRQTTVSKDSTEAESKAYALASEVTVGLQDLLAEILEVYWAPVPLRGDCNGCFKIMVNGTDRRHHAAFKKALSYTEDKVNRALIFLDFILRQYTDADNLCQQGTPYEHWRDRRDHMMGQVTRTHVSETIRETQRQHRRLLQRNAESAAAED